MKEALKLALESMKRIDAWLIQRGYTGLMPQEKEVITSIESALAQPTSGDYAHGYVEGFNDACMPKPAQQEPVAFLVDDDLYYPEEIDWETLQEQGHTVAALYTSPPAQRTWGKPWVSLTDDEIWKFWCSRPEVSEGEDDSMEAEFVTAVRAVLAAHGIKEKNT